MSFEVKDKQKQKRADKPKREMRIGLAALPAHDKQKAERERSKTSVDFDISEDSDQGACFADVTFTMDDGQTIQLENMDICGLDAIVVENVPLKELDPAAAQ